ncbi:hypothetical protein ACIQWR_13870 [Streptomyces sp. NPDC098789]|uniref:hypothetical protein n=1 Tax=Streptomyces sp. NPDC098789 TaxID=3366098 RepID=UPI0038261C62
MSVTTAGPAWAREGLGPGGPKYPLAVEGPVMRAVDRLVPGLSGVTKYVRYPSLYAALAAHAQEERLDREECRALLRRAEVLLAAVSGAPEPELTAADPTEQVWSAHGIDGVRPFSPQDGPVELALAAAAYSPRSWGFWDQYGGPAQVLGLVELREGALRPGRHACPAPVRDLFAPLLALARPGSDRIDGAALAAARRAALGAPCEAERAWLTSVMTASRHGVHRPGDWTAQDRTRRATLRLLARSVALHGEGQPSFLCVLRDTVAFGDQVAVDPVLAGIPEAAGWRGLLLRHYSVGAWRRLWAALVGEVAAHQGAADRSAADLRAWLAGQMPADLTLEQALAGLGPLSDPDGHPRPVERVLMTTHPPSCWREVRLLLVGALRSREGALGDDVRAVFLGRQRLRREFLDPTWVEGLVREYGDRPLAEFAGRLVDDMLAQSRRVALAKIRTERGTGRVKVFSRLHVRGERYFSTGEESSAEIGTRVPQLGRFGLQLGLFEREGESLRVTPAGRAILEVSA